MNSEKEVSDMTCMGLFFIFRAVEPDYNEMRISKIEYNFILKSIHVVTKLYTFKEETFIWRHLIKQKEKRKLNQTRTINISVSYMIEMRIQIIFCYSI